MICVNDLIYSDSESWFKVLRYEQAWTILYNIWLKPEDKEGEIILSLVLKILK